MEDLQPVRAAARSFETARLLLRPYEPGDLAPMAEMFGDRDVTAHTLLGYRTPEQTAEVLAGYRSFLAARGYGMLSIIDKATGAYRGEVGLFVTPMGPLALRYALAKAAWGKGFATEAPVPVIDDAFEGLGLHRLLAGVIETNVASIKVVDKLGFAFDSVVNAGGKEFNLYTLSRAAWQERRRAG